MPRYFLGASSIRNMFFQRATRIGTSILSRSATCLGWRCLTAAEKFGIIFSAAIVFLVLSLAYMYCLGRACIASKDREASRLTARRNSHSRSYGAPPNVRQSLPTAQNQLILRPATLGQQTTNFTFTLARLYVQPACYYGTPLVPSTYASHTNQYPACYPPPTVTEPEAPQVQQVYEQAIDPSIADRVHAKSPGWRRRINQILRIPVGTASTIHTNSAPGSPTSVRHEGAVPRGDGDLEHNDKKLQTPKKGSRHGRKESRDLESGKTEAASIRSTAATVHSDDFEIISPTSSIEIQPRAQLTPSSRTQKNTAAVVGN